MREGMPRKNQMWATLEFSSMWPMRSRRTEERVTSTPHFSQTMPLYFSPLYLPHRQRKSWVGPKILAQNSPSRSGLKVR